MNVFSVRMPFQESSETDPNCVCEEVGTLTESTVVSAECDKLSCRILKISCLALKHSSLLAFTD